MHVSRADLMRQLPLAAGAAGGLIVAAAAMLLPAALLESLTESSGLAAVLPVAAPPLGVTARALLALAGGIGVAAVTWAALYLLVGPGGLLVPRAKPASDRPTVRRADAHPDAPPRRPLSADELPVPAPVTLPPVEQPLPRDLDMPLAVFDPDALPPVPSAPAQALKPLAPPLPKPATDLAPGERFETYTLTPPPPAPPASPGDEPPSIDALLRRLEQGARRRAAAG